MLLLSAASSASSPFDLASKQSSDWKQRVTAKGELWRLFAFICELVRCVAHFDFLRQIRQIRTLDILSFCAF